MLETTIELVKSRSTSYQAAKMRDFQTVQLRIRVHPRISMRAALLIRNDTLDIARIYESGGTPDIETRLALQRNSASAGKLCVDAVNSLYEMAGANGIYDHSPLQRQFRDMRAAAGHFTSAPTHNFHPGAGGARR
jgi:alkylation response protein AidB-like acyl-CoA dehydrogenase